MSTLKNIQRFLLIFPLQWQSCSMYTESKHRKQDTHKHAQQRSDYTSTEQENIQSVISSRPHQSLSFQMPPFLSSPKRFTLVLNYGLETTTNYVISFFRCLSTTF